MAKTMWREAPEVKEIADHLIPEHHQEIELWMDEIRYVFRDEAAKSKGRTVLGKAHKVGGMACYLIHSATGDLNEFGDQPKDCFVVEIAFDAWEVLTARQREALVDHELCLPAGTIVTGPRVLSGAARWYSGHLVTIRTAAGNLLSGTPNHPVLTDKGWVPLGFLKEGDHVIRCADPEGVAAAVDPDQYQMPALIEKVAGSSEVGLGVVPQAPQDLYAHVLHYKVDVVGADRLLLVRCESSLGEHGEKTEFGRGDAIHMPFSGSGSLRQILSGMSGAQPKRISSGDALTGQSQFLGSLHPGGLGCPAVSTFDASLVQSARYDSVGNPQVESDGVRSFPTEVPFDDSGPVERQASASESDVGLAQNSVDDGGADAKILTDYLAGLPGDVSLDEIVLVKIGAFAGHVYNLRTSQG